MYAAACASMRAPYSIPVTFIATSVSYFFPSCAGRASRRQVGGDPVDPRMHVLAAAQHNPGHDDQLGRKALCSYDKLNLISQASPPCAPLGVEKKGRRGATDACGAHTYLIFRGSIHPMQSLCTLRNHCRQWPRNTRYQADATPYLGRTCTGWIAPALPGALIRSPRQRAAGDAMARQGRALWRS